MLIGNVPFNNILAVIILLFMKPDGEKKDAGNLAKETVKGILTNPIIHGIHSRRGNASVRLSCAAGADRQQVSAQSDQSGHTAWSHGDGWLL